MTQIEETFGYQLFMAKANANIADQQFVIDVNKALVGQSAQEKITAKLLQEWESNKKVPLDPMIETIVEVIQQKSGISEDDAKKLKDDLLAAAGETRAILASGGKPSKDKSWFGDMLKQKMTDYNVSAADFISATNAPNITLDDLYKIQQGISTPSPRIVDAFNSVLKTDFKHQAAGEGVEKTAKQLIAEISTYYEEDLLRTRNNNCGSVAISELKQGVVTSRGRKALSRRLEGTLGEETISDGIFKKGPYKDVNLLDLVKQVVREAVNTR